MQVCPCPTCIRGVLHLIVSKYFDIIKHCVFPRIHGWCFVAGTILLEESMKKCLFPVFVALVLMGCADTTSSSSDDNACGNGVVDAGEKCDIKVAVTCQQFDATKTWQD